MSCPRRFSISLTYCKMFSNVNFTVKTSDNYSACSTLWCASVCNGRDLFAILISFVSHLACLLIEAVGKLCSLLDDLFYVVYSVITWTSQKPGCIMGHMGSKQSLPACQILWLSSDSSAVCPGCHGCCHSNWVGRWFAFLLIYWRKFDLSVLATSPW